MTENLVPLTEDLTKEDNKLNIIRGLEQLQRVDKTIADGESFREGEYAVLTDSDELVSPGASSVSNCFPVWAGNAEGRSDVHATGKATILMGQGFIYRTSVFNDAETYSVGDGITCKDNSKIPTLASGNDKILGRVVGVSEEGLLEIKVTHN